MNKSSIRLDAILERTALIIVIASIAIPPLRYLVYCLPALALLTLLANRRASLPSLSIPYLVILTCGLPLLLIGNADGAKDLFLIATGLSVSIVGHRIFPRWRSLFLLCFIGFIINAVLKGAFSLQSVAFDVTSSTSSFESGFSFIFGLLAVWALNERNWKNFALATAFAFLSLKRIVIIAIFICLVIQFGPTFIREKIISPTPMLALNLLAILLLLLYGAGYFDALILQYTGKSANAFGMGRKALYSAAANEILENPWKFIIGMGPGAAYNLATAGALVHDKENLHSDIIKIFSEYGVLVFIAFIGFFYSQKNSKYKYLAIYTNVLLATDNTLIYPFYLFFLMLISKCISEKHTPNQYSSDFTHNDHP